MTIRMEKGGTKRQNRLTTPRKTKEVIETEDDLLTAEEKRAAMSEVKRQNAEGHLFPATDWEAIDPDNIPDDLATRYSKMVGVKRWAKVGDTGEVSLDLARKYIRESWSKRQKEARLEAEARAAKLEKRISRSETTDTTLQKKIDGYLAFILSPTPNDLANIRSLCSLEMRLESLQDDLDSLRGLSDETLRKRAAVSDEWGKCATQYRGFQDALNITKTKRDASSDGKGMAELYQEDMAAASAWMESEMSIVLCPNPECQAEIAWLWWAYEHVHQPQPHYFVGRCACGTLVRSGDHKFGKEVA